MNRDSRGDKTDLRVVKTREAIQSAFERLLETTEYDSITVSGIAREARVSRKTFYAHYSSVDELLRKMALDVVEGVACNIQPEGELLGIEEWIAAFSRCVLTTLRENPHLNGNVMRCVPLPSLLDMLRDPILDICSAELEKRGLEMLPGHDYYLPFYFGGLFSVYETWLASGQDAAALDEMASFIARTTSRGITELLKAE